MRVTVDNHLTIHEPTKEMFEWCKGNLVLPNPDFYKKERMGKWTGNTPKDIWLFERFGDDLVLPFGCWRRINEAFPGMAWDSKILRFEPHCLRSGINLYPYQEKAVNEAVMRRNGILVMPTGSGKTQCGLEIVARLGGRALWLTHTQDLLNQSKNRAESVLEYEPGMFGTITAGKVDIGTHITFATVQTMAKLKLSDLKDTFNVIITDEVHHAAGSPTKVTQFYKVLSSLSAMYKIGLTATPKRADGLEKSMFALLGDVICGISREDVKHTTCPVKVITERTGWMPEFDAVLLGDGTLDYNRLIDNVIHSQERYEVVFSRIRSIIGPCMVLANRVEYLKRLCDDYNAYCGKAICLSGMGQSKKAKAERKQALEALNNGELDCVFCTYSLAAEGLDVPNLRYIVFATPEKNDVTVTQATGRVSRKAEGKEYGTVIDFVDDFGLYKGFYKERLGVYKKLNCDIIE